MKTSTVEEFQNSQHESAENSTPFNLSDFARKMVDERQAESAGEDVDLWAGFDVEVERDEAYGLIQGKVRAWLDEQGRIAQEDEIRAKTNELYSEANYATPRPATEASWTVDPSGNVTSFETHAASGDLPGMPPAPEPEPQNGLRVPSDSQFVDGWAESTMLLQRAVTLIQRHPDDLEHLHGMPMSFRWRQKGGKSRGRPVMGQTVKTGGLLKHFSASTFVIWLAADHIRAAGYGDRQIEALLFRQLLAAGVAEIDEDTGRGGGATFVPPQIQAYEAEIRVYGPWEPAQKEAARTFQQVSLFDARGVVAKAVTEAQEILDREPTLDLSGAGILIHDDGTPFTAEEIAAQEAAELRDDPSEDDEGDTPTLFCSVCKEGIYHDELTSEEAKKAEADSSTLLCEDCASTIVHDGEDDDSDLAV